MELILKNDHKQWGYKFSLVVSNLGGMFYFTINYQFQNKYCNTEYCKEHFQNYPYSTERDALLAGLRYAKGSFMYTRIKRELVKHYEQEKHKQGVLF